MTLADFLETHVDEILGDVEEFARTLLPAAGRLDSEALRDHIPLIVHAIAKDLQTVQTPNEGRLKGLGLAPVILNAPATAAQTHALLRANDGFAIEQLVAEYRALRSSVLRLWMLSKGQLDVRDMGDLVRFGEAIDQALAESMAAYVAEVDRWRHVFLGVLGHDLRGPLNAILLTSELLVLLAKDDPIAAQTTRLLRSGKRMKGLLDDLLEFSRGSLGVGMVIHRNAVDLAAACADELEILRASLPYNRLELHAAGDTSGPFDASRVRELLSNLVLNAAKYGVENEAIDVTLSGSGQSVTVTVENTGELVTGQSLEALFQPMRRGASEDEEGANRSSLGLGLFIVREIAKAHGGTVQVTSANGKTTFTVELLKNVA